MQSTAIAKEKEKPARKISLVAIIPFLGLAFVIALFSILTKGEMLVWRNLNTVLNQAYSVLLLALGATFIYASGCNDMAYGAVLGLTCLCGILVARGLGFIWIFPTVLAVGVVCYCSTGAAVGWLALPAFIASMCIRYISNGIVTTVTSSIGVLAPGQVFTYDSWTVKIIVLIIMIALIYLVFEYTKAGKIAKAIGGNANTTEQSGYSVRHYRLLCYVIAGLMVGVASFFNIAHTGSVTSNTGTGLELQVMTAVVLGGLPMSGGARANVRCAVIGALTIAFLENGLVLIGASSAVAQGFQGAVFLATVAISYERPANYLYN